MKAKSITSTPASAVAAAILATFAFAAVSVPAEAAPAKQHQNAKVSGADDHPLGVWGGYPFWQEAR